MENQLSNQDHQVEDATSTIEHILPENPGSVWETNFPPEDQPDYINRVGNFSLLEASINHKLHNEVSFDEKLEFYKKSSFKITNETILFTEWSPETINQRQRRMASWAKRIWKSSFLL